MTTRIIGTGSALPEEVITNDDMAKIVDTSDEWISSRTGIRQRKLVGRDENVVTLGTEAARKALEDSGAAPEERKPPCLPTAFCECTPCMPPSGTGRRS